MNANSVRYSSEIASWRYPRDRWKIGRLSIEWFQFWYLAQDARDMVYLGQFKEFQRFVFWNYTIPVRCLRLFYKLKRTLFHASV